MHGKCVRNAWIVPESDGTDDKRLAQPWIALLAGVQLPVATGVGKIWNNLLGVLTLSVLPAVPLDQRVVRPTRRRSCRIARAAEERIVAASALGIAALVATHRVGQHCPALRNRVHIAVHSERPGLRQGGARPREIESDQLETVERVVGAHEFRAAHVLEIEILVLPQDRGRVQVVDAAATDPVDRECKRAHRDVTLAPQAVFVHDRHGLRRTVDQDPQAVQGLGSALPCEIRDHVVGGQLQGQCANGAHTEWIQHIDLVELAQAKVAHLSHGVQDPVAAVGRSRGGDQCHGDQ